MIKTMGFTKQKLPNSPKMKGENEEKLKKFAQIGQCNILRNKEL
jgi:hypothetical protein